MENLSEDDPIMVQLGMVFIWCCVIFLLENYLKANKGLLNALTMIKNKITLSYNTTIVIRIAEIEQQLGIINLLIKNARIP